MEVLFQMLELFTGFKKTQNNILGKIHLAIKMDFFITLRRDIQSRDFHRGFVCGKACENQYNNCDNRFFGIKSFLAQ